MIKDAIAVVSGLVVGLAIIAGLFVVEAAPEESTLFNCYISGDAQCGPTAVWHGFVNIGVEDPR